MAVKESDETKDTNEEDEPVSSDMDQAAIKKMIA